MTNFTFECEEVDGLMFVDRDSLGRFDSTILAELDILLDPLGKSELRFDFPSQPWSEVWLTETNNIRELIASGTAVLYLFEAGHRTISVQIHSDSSAVGASLLTQSGNVLALSSSELIQCLSYPGLTLETFMEQEVVPGWYNIQSRDFLQFALSPTSKKSPTCDNLITTF